MKVEIYSFARRRVITVDKKLGEALVKMKHASFDLEAGQQGYKTRMLVAQSPAVPAIPVPPVAPPVPTAPSLPADKPVVPEVAPVPTELPKADKPEPSFPPMTTTTTSVDTSSEEKPEPRKRGRPSTK